MVAALREATPAGVPLIGLLVHGGAIALGETLGKLDAVRGPRRVCSHPASLTHTRARPQVLDAWYPGLEGAPAIAAALLGDTSPAGRSPVTWYKASSELPPPGHMGW